MILYGSSLSPFVRKVLAFAGEKGIELQLEPGSPFNPTPEFLDASPFRKMPALRDGNYTLADSSAIIHYLDAKYPERPLIPGDPELRGKTIWYDEFGDTIVCACGAKIFFNKIVAPRFLGRAGDDAAAEAAECNELPPILDCLEKNVPGEEGYLVGDGLTLADISVASPFANLRHTHTRVDPERYPRTVAYVERILARPSFSTWIEREAELLAKQAA